MKLTTVEINRKLIHITSAIIPLVYWFWIPKQWMVYGLILINLVFFLIEYERLRGTRLGDWLGWFFKPAIRSQEKHRVTGAAFVFLGNLITIAWFPMTIAVPALLILSISDAFAALVGIPLGKHRLGSKSVEGSLAFFVVSVVVLMFFPAIPWVAKLIGAAIGTLVEVYVNFVDDNITIPVSVALSLLIFI
ncbi:MAG: hypothetical protein K9N11_08350 [Lentisphaeria bacterium]|nr:hypothetical protein [Candidatus Neomarinimicrobiota bacterium]MCF7842846.1 hypothetical protein [Lentisphaeria bacterium]